MQGPSYKYGLQKLLCSFAVYIQRILLLFRSVAWGCQRWLEKQNSRLTLNYLVVSIYRNVNYGWLIRTLRANRASFLFVFVQGICYEKRI